MSSQKKFQKVRPPPPSIYIPVYICACFWKFEKKLPFYVHTFGNLKMFYHIQCIFLPYMMISTTCVYFYHNYVKISTICVDFPHICTFWGYLIFGQNQEKKNNTPPPKKKKKKKTNDRFKLAKVDFFKVTNFLTFWNKSGLVVWKVNLWREK